MSKIYDNGVIRDATSEETESIHARIGGGEPQLANAIINTVKGSNITLNDSASNLVNALTICGKSTQDGTPSIDSPIPIVNASTDITINNVKHNIDIAILRGIPVTSDGNYTDENNQQWLCDTIERYANGTGKIIQRVNPLALDGTESWNNAGQRVVTQLPTIVDSSLAGQKTMCNSLQLVTNATDVTNIDNAYILANSGRLLCSPTINNTRLTTTEWKTFLSSNDVVIYIPFDTPIEIPLTALQLSQLDLSTYYPTTTISSDSGLVIEYIADTKNYIDNK